MTEHLWVSFTTIPSRVERLVPTTLQSLSRQDEPVERILVTIPTVNRRGQTWDHTLPESVTSPTDARIQVVRPDWDAGPIMKYLGVLQGPVPEDPEHTWVFVCDDDQEYLPGVISSLQKVRHQHFPLRKDVVISHTGSTNMFLTTPAGFGGVLVHYQTLQELNRWWQEKSPQMVDCCHLVDDNVMAAFYHQKGIHAEVLHTDYAQLFTKVNAAEEDALHTAHQRQTDNLRCLWSVEPAHVVAVILLIVAAVAFVILTAWGTVKWWRGRSALRLNK